MGTMFSRVAKRLSPILLSPQRYLSQPLSLTVDRCWYTHEFTNFTAFQNNNTNWSLVLESNTAAPLLTLLFANLLSNPAYSTYQTISVGTLSTFLPKEPDNNGNPEEQFINIGAKLSVK